MSSKKSYVYYMPPEGVPTETKICEMFDNFMNNVKNRSDKAIIYEYILAKAKEALRISTATNQSNDEKYTVFHNITNDVQRHISIIVRNRIYSYILAEAQEALEKLSSSGGKRTAPATPSYKSTGDKVFIFIDNKKLHRSIYVKGNGKAKYCKINNEFILLSKLKNKVIE